MGLFDRYTGKKRILLLQQLRADRKLSGRGQKARHYRSTGRPTATRREALAMFQLNRTINAQWARADRREGYRRTK